MKPEVQIITQILPDHSVICILGGDHIPERLMLSTQEIRFAQAQLQAKDEYIFINSYNKSTYFIRLKDNIPHYKIREELRRTAYNLKKLIRENNHAELVITSDMAYKGAIEDFTEGLLLSIYSFDKYKTKAGTDNKKHYPEKLLLNGDIQDSEIKWIIDLTDAIYFTRDLIQEPVNQLNATSLSSEIKKIGDSAGFKVEVLTKGKIEALKMGGLLAVNKGSVDPPVFCILDWHPANCRNDKPIVLVGKGIVYDTGGLNIKTGDFMAGMKGDMAGAAIVTGVLYIAAKSGIPLHIIGLVPSTDNRPGGNAYTQGDIITMYNKMSVEVGNTDAEGRLILADAISYSSKYMPELILDIATLTGAACVALGERASAIFTDNDQLSNDFEKIAEKTGDYVWRLPMWEEYENEIKGTLGDYTNIHNKDSRYGGAIYGAVFLHQFIKGYKWAHIDMAPRMVSMAGENIAPGAVGSPVRLLYKFIEEYK